MRSFLTRQENLLEPPLSLVAQLKLSFDFQLLLAPSALLLTLAITLFLGSAAELFADSYDLYGVLPFWSQTGRINDSFDYNIFTSTTINAKSREFKGNTVLARDTQTYLQPSIIYKFSPDLNFTLGYVYQRSNPFSSDYANENRIWQQVLYGSEAWGGRLTNRVRYEERFIHNRSANATPLSTRARYQIAYSHPLEGRELDPGEFYANSYNEFYFSLSGDKNATYSENWSYVGLGYLIPGLGKVELGPLYQVGVVDKRGDKRDFLLLQFGLSTSF